MFERKQIKATIIADYRRENELVCMLERAGFDYCRIEEFRERHVAYPDPDNPREIRRFFEEEDRREREEAGIL